jgi:hypothetical protein
MNNAMQTVLNHRLGIVRLEYPLQQQNGLTYASLAQQSGIFTLQQGETISFFTQGINHAHLSMAVAICLDHCPSPGIRRMCLGLSVIV